MVRRKHHGCNPSRLPRRMVGHSPIATAPEALMSLLRTIVAGRKP
jgi:hypothetical protein